MQITVLGTGIVARTLAARLLELGHNVVMETRDITTTKSRPATGNNASFSDWLQTHKNISLAPFGSSVLEADLVINAVNGKAVMEVLQVVGAETLKGKTLLDLSNPLDFSNGMPPTLFVSNDDSLAEQIQRQFPETNVVKCLNTMNTNIMLNPKLIRGDHVVFLSGNNEIAKHVVRELLSQAGWLARNMIDLGDITTSRGSEQLLPLWIRLLNALGTSAFNFNIVRK